MTQFSRREHFPELQNSVPVRSSRNWRAVRRGIYGGAIGYIGFLWKPGCLHCHPHCLREEGERFMPGPEPALWLTACRKANIRNVINKARAVVLAVKTSRGGNGIMIVLIDNYDSFSYNLYQHDWKYPAGYPGHPQRPDQRRRTGGHEAGG